MKKEKLLKVENTNKGTNSSVENNKEAKTSTKKEVKAKASKKEAKAEEPEKPSKKDKLTKELALQQAVEIVEKVAKERAVKYKYPEDVKDSLSRKTWRQKVRSKLRQLELAKARIEDQNSKEFKKALKEYEAYSSEVLQEVKTA